MFKQLHFPYKLRTHLLSTVTDSAVKYAFSLETIPVLWVSIEFILLSFCAVFLQWAVCTVKGIGGVFKSDRVSTPSTPKSIIKMHCCQQMIVTKT